MEHRKHRLQIGRVDVKEHRKDGRILLYQVGTDGEYQTSQPNRPASITRPTAGEETASSACLWALLPVLLAY